ncbi:MAG: hypothetical protein IJO64_00195 [Clostridia bacterium]|nr:hypothetical protein [Clostridia bacterium]MBQ9847464.1 hypothetical protein [Clostridia bacterium]
MKTCWKCNRDNDDSVCYCAFCGAELKNDAHAEEQRFLDNCHRFLRYERLAYRITGIVFPILALLYVLLAFVYAGYPEQVDEEMIGLVLIPIFVYIIFMFVVYAVLFLGAGLVNLIASFKMTNTLNSVYTDLSVVQRRNGSAKRIVFAAFFNSIALVFVIINFVRFKSNKQLVERIIAKQKGTFNSFN